MINIKQGYDTLISIKVLLRFWSNLIPIGGKTRLVDANTKHRYTTKYE